MPNAVIHLVAPRLVPLLAIVIIAMDIAARFSISPTALLADVVVDLRRRATRLAYPGVAR